jgi:predicted Zn-dependent peptidase
VLSLYRQILSAVLLAVVFVGASCVDVSAADAQEIASHLTVSERLSEGKTQINIPVKVDGIHYASHRLNASTRVIKEHLMQVLRREMGATYHVSVKVQTHKSQKFVSISFSSAPERTQELIAATLDTLHMLSQKGATQKEVDAIKLSQRERLEQKLQNNDYWMRALVERTEKGYSIDGIKSTVSVIDSLTRQELSQTLKQVDPKDDYSIVCGS